MLFTASRFVSVLLQCILLLHRMRKEDKSSAVAEVAAQCCAGRIAAFEWGVLYFLTNSFSENITMNHILPKARFFGLHFSGG